jgi:hypothetical protein
MAASFPGSVKSWTPVVDNVTAVLAAHVNEAYDEIIAIENQVKTDEAVLTKTQKFGILYAYKNIGGSL